MGGTNPPGQPLLTINPQQLRQPYTSVIVTRSRLAGVFMQRMRTPTRQCTCVSHVWVKM